MLPEDYIAFLVRLWQDHPDDEQDSGWRGEIEQIQDGARLNFHTPDELLAFLHRVVVAPCSNAVMPLEE